MIKINLNEDKTEEAKEPLKLIAMDINGIRCINDDTHETEWEIKFNSEAEYRRAARIMRWVGSHMNNFLAASDEKHWADFLSGKISEGTFMNTLKASYKITDHDKKAFASVGANAPEEVKQAWMDAAKETGVNGPCIPNTP